VLVLAAVLSACASSPSPPVTSSASAPTTTTTTTTTTLPPASCVVSASEVATAVSGHVLTPVAETVLKGSGCRFPFEGGGVVAVRIFGDGPAAFEKARTGLPDNVDVTGVGDEAIWSESVKALHVLTAGKTLQVQVLVDDSAPSRVAAEALARLVVPRVSGN